jgi:hypothetical protein
LKNLQIGYSIPKGIVEKLKMSSIRFYVSISNLLTFDHFRKGWDPETKRSYPPIRYSNLGLNVNF